MKTPKRKEQVETTDESLEYLNVSTGSYSAIEANLGKPVKKTQIGFIRQKQKRKKK